MLQVLKHLQSPTLPVAFLLFLHQYCDMRWLQLAQLSECQWATSVKIFIASWSYVMLIFELLNTIPTVVGVLSMCQLMTSSHTVIVHSLLVFLEYGWCNLITPVLLLCYSDLNQVSICMVYSSVITHTHIAALPLSNSRCLLLVCECGVHHQHFWEGCSVCYSLTTHHAAV